MQIDEARAIRSAAISGQLVDHDMLLKAIRVIGRGAAVSRGIRHVWPVEQMSQAQHDRINKVP